MFKEISFVQNIDIGHFACTYVKRESLASGWDLSLSPAASGGRLLRSDLLLRELPDRDGHLSPPTQTLAPVAEHGLPDRLPVGDPGTDHHPCLCGHRQVRHVCSARGLLMAARTVCSVRRLLMAARTVCSVRRLLMAARTAESNPVFFN